MCGGGRKSSPAPAAKAEAPASTPAAGASTPLTAQEGPQSASSSAGSMARRRRAGKNRFRVGLDVNVANVGGTGATGLNIPKSD